jgi:glycosyltransferase involved in cell wall biosynthesis
VRVCLVANRFYDDNAHMMQFANALARRGDEVDVICVRRDGLESHAVLRGVNVFRIQRRIVNERGRWHHLFRLVTFLLRAACVLTKHHFRKPYQVIHVQSIPDFLVLAAVVPKMLGARLILDLRDLVPELYASKFGINSDSIMFRALARVERLSAGFADHVITANPLWHDRIVQRSAPASKCTMIWYYPDPAIFYPRPKRRMDDRFLILYPGTLNRHQGIDVAVRAFPAILREAPEARFEIYGEGAFKPRLLRMIDELGLSGHVGVHDLLPVERIADVMADADLAVVPKRISDGFGDEAASTKIWEFMALGVPVVAARTRVEQCMLGDSLVCYFEPENESALAKAVLSLRNSPEKRRTLIANGRRYIERGAWETTMAAYIDIVNELAGIPRRQEAGVCAPGQGSKASR